MVTKMARIAPGHFYIKCLSNPFVDRAIQEVDHE